MNWQQSRGKEMKDLGLGGGFAGSGISPSAES